MAVLPNIAYYVTAMLLGRGAGFVQTFALARMLGPDGFGIWVTIILLISYCPIFNLGALETMVKQVPFHHARKELAQMRQTEDAVLGSSILTSSFILFLAALAPLIVPLTAVRVSPYLASVALISVSVRCFSDFFYFRFAAYEDFKRSGMIDTFRAVAALIFVSILAWAWGLNGAVVGYLLHEISVCLLAAWSNIRNHGPVRPTFQWSSFATVVRIGFPITLLWWTFMVTFGIDRLILGKLAGATSVGYYSLGISIVSVVAMLPKAVGRVLYPRVNKQLGLKTDLPSMRRLVIGPTLALATLVNNVQGVILVGMPLLYTVLLPKYREGLLSGEILVVGAFFSFLLQNGANYLIADNQNKPLLRYIFVTLAFNAAADVIMIKTGCGIVGVACGTSLAGLLLTTLVWTRVLESLEFRGRQLWGTLFHLYLPVLILGVLAGALLVFKPGLIQTVGGWSLVIGVALLVAMNLILAFFPVYRAEMQYWKNTLAGLGKPKGPGGSAEAPFTSRAADCGSDFQVTSKTSASKSPITSCHGWTVRLDSRFGVVASWHGTISA